MDFSFFRLSEKTEYIYLLIMRILQKHEVCFGTLRT